MKKEEFQLGQEFYTETGKWQCTDIGTRVIVAIQLNQEDSSNYNDPPFSIAEYVFDETDIESCSLNSVAFEDNIADIIKSKKFNEIEDAFMFTNSAGYGENSALLDKNTGKVYFHSDWVDVDEQDVLAEEDFDSTVHIHLPHKNDLDLGKDLVFEFTEQYMPDDEYKVDQIFSKKGAYSRFKDLLQSKDLLEKWYEFENRHQQIALIQWCKENDISF